MAKIIEVTVEIKKSVDYQGYGASMRATIEEGEHEEIVAKEMYAKCRKLTLEQIELDKGAKAL